MEIIALAIRIFKFDKIKGLESKNMAFGWVERAYELALFGGSKAMSGSFERHGCGMSRG